MRDCLSVAQEVVEALTSGRAVVALESTIVAHGMPYPENLDTAKTLESIVRAGGAVPATVAVLDGKLKIGLGSDDLLRIARGNEVAKLSRRDLPLAVAGGGVGATTVSATMTAAALAGIRVFATGGIGGVHRGAESSFDVSADLLELSRTSVAVVSAGAKAILDLPKTLEVLETYGVPVIGYRTHEFPAFYCRTSGLPVDRRVETAAEVAEIMAATWDLGLDGGLLVANPIPEPDALPREAVDGAIAAAVAEARVQGIGGKDATPFLLRRVAELTGGRSLKANMALVKNNVALAAEIAVVYAARTRATGRSIGRRRPSARGR
jgi:pseudouridine-5'-phosphate glycosidase